MKVLLIGADGQLGTDLVLSCPAKVTLIASTINDLDITDRDAVERRIKAEKPDAIINTAAYVKVDQAEEELKEAMMLNAIAVSHLALACRENNSLLVQFSTDYVFDGLKGSDYLESDQPNPINIYGLTKWAGEIFALDYCPDSYVIRLASLYGKAGAQGKGGNFVYSILKTARHNLNQKLLVPLNVVDDIVMSPTYSLDVAQRVWQMIDGQSEPGIYHMTNRGACSWFEFAEAILKAAKLDVPVEAIKQADLAAKAHRPIRTSLDSEKGTLLRPWEEAVADFVSNLPTS